MLAQPAEHVMDYQEVVDRKLKIVGAPVHRIPAETMKAVVEELYRRCPKSAQQFAELKKVVPGGLEHNLGSNKPFAISYGSARGCKMYDIDGNEYIDYVMDGGPIILGHHFEPLDSKIVELIQEHGPAVGLTHELELALAQEIVKHFPGIEMVRLLASGTEADLFAIRLARRLHGQREDHQDRRELSWLVRSAAALAELPRHGSGRGHGNTAQLLPEHAGSPPKRF